MSFELQEKYLCQIKEEDQGKTVGTRENRSGSVSVSRRARALFFIDSYSSAKIIWVPKQYLQYCLDVYDNTEGARHLYILLIDFYTFYMRMC